VAFSGKGASKPFLASGCPFISFFLASLWSYSKGPDLGLPAVIFYTQKNRQQITTFFSADALPY
jgi:hypothetical protein